MFLLDTDILTLLIYGHDKVVRRFSASSSTGLVATTIISEIEILRGRYDSILKASTPDELLRARDRLASTRTDLARITVMPIPDLAVAEFERLTKIKTLRKIGRPDLLIASIALAHDATLVTRNLKHFKLVPGLRIENWAD